MSAEASGPIRILLVDDHPVVRAGLASMLRTFPDFEVVGSMADGAQAVALLTETSVDIVLLDLRMPGMDGIATLQALRKLQPAPRVIVLTSYESDEDVYEAVRAGALGYLLKNCSEEELIEAIHVVHGGERYFPRHIAARFAKRSPRQNLSARQAEILDLIARHLTDRQVAKALGISTAEIWKELHATVEPADRPESQRGQADDAQPRKPTMADIARKAGVSLATVSRVLNNKGMHTEETRRLVMEVVREYNFEQNDAAARLAMLRPSAQET